MRKLALCLISAAVTIATTTSVFAASPWYKDDGKWRYIQNGRQSLDWQLLSWLKWCNAH